MYLRTYWEIMSDMTVGICQKVSLVVDLPYAMFQFTHSRDCRIQTRLHMLYSRFVSDLSPTSTLPYLVHDMAPTSAPYLDVESTLAKLSLSDKIKLLTGQVRFLHIMSIRCVF